MKPLKLLLILSIAAVITPAITSAALAPSADAAQPLGIGEKAPSAMVVNSAGEQVDLASQLGGKPTLLIFYRGGWCPYCNKHLGALSEVESEMVAMGYQIIGVSPDTVAALAETADKKHVPYTLLSDRAMEASSAYGLAFRMDAETQQKYLKYGFDLASIPGEPSAHWLPVPAAYIVAPDGMIKFVYTNANYKTRVTSDDLLEAAKAALE